MRLRFLFLFFVTIFIFSIAISPSKTEAVSPSSILINVTPENPAPGENTKITLNSYVSNLDSVLIEWFVDDQKVLSGIGKKSFSLTAPASGEERIVTISISLPDGSIDKRIVVKPSVTVLLWQANDSYTPPFYRGKALPTPDSEIKVVAMPEIKTGSSIVNPNNLVYSWKQDYNNMQEASGYGKNFYLYINDYLEDSNNISVVASTTDQKSSSTANINVGTTDVKILFYKNDINMGTLWEHALPDMYRIEGDALLEAAPYFISPNDLRIPILSWIWSINDNTIETPTVKKNLIPLKVPTGTSGTSKIKLNIENKYRIFGTASGEINLTF